MDSKKIIFLVVIICLVIIGAIFLYNNQEQNNDSIKLNNTTNITKNDTTNITNNTLNDTVESTEYESSTESYSEGEPDYGSDDYVKKWDESQQNEDDWAYTHDQPVKTENGHEYKRMYDEKSGESYWYQMDKEK